MKKRIKIVGVLNILSVLFLFGCVDNEESFYIEHVKQISDDCEFSTGDNYTPSFSINLFRVNNPVSGFMVTNSLMKQEDKGTLKNESNGIMIDGYEVYTLIPDKGAIGGTDYFTYNQYIKPESSDVAIVGFMSTEVINTIRDAYGCVSSNIYTPDVIKDAIIYPSSENSHVAKDLINGKNGHLSDLPPVMTAVVKFLGHSQGGKNVETQEFSVMLKTYCGVHGGWSACLDSACTALCSSSSVDITQECAPGVSETMTCSDYLKSAGSMVKGTWKTVLNAEGKEDKVFTIDPKGKDEADYCKEFCK